MQPVSSSGASLSSRATRRMVAKGTRLLRLASHSLLLTRVLPTANGYAVGDVLTQQLGVSGSSGVLVGAACAATASSRRAQNSASWVTLAPCARRQGAVAARQPPQMLAAICCRQEGGAAQQPFTCMHAGPGRSPSWNAVAGGAGGMARRQQHGTIADAPPLLL